MRVIGRPSGKMRHGEIRLCGFAVRETGAGPADRPANLARGPGGVVPAPSPRPCCAHAVAAGRETDDEARDGIAGAGHPGRRGGT